MLCALLFVACGDSAPTPSPDTASLDGTVGYWQTPSEKAVLPEAALLHVEKRGDTYYLGIDGRQPKPATLAGGRIVLPWDVGGGAQLGCGESDTLRIKFWEQTSGEVIYDT